MPRVNLSIGLAFRKPGCHLDLPLTDLRKMGLAFAQGCSGGGDILNKIEKTSKYVAARDLALKLKKSLSQGGDVFTEYRSPVILTIKTDENNIRYDTSNIARNRSEVEKWISQLAMSKDKKMRPAVKQLDALLYGNFK